MTDTLSSIKDIQIKDAELTTLRQEIVESQKARIGLLQYKLLAIAVLGAIGIGVGNYRADPGIMRPDFVLAIIPFICIYIDSLCWHNTLRILVIGQFLVSQKDRYELFIGDLDKQLNVFGIKSGVAYLFQMEDWALHVSTILVCYLLLFLGIVNLSLGLVAAYINEIESLIKDTNPFLQDVVDELKSIIKDVKATKVSLLVHGFVFLASSLSGIIFSYHKKRQYKNIQESLFFVSGELRRTLD